MSIKRDSFVFYRSFYEAIQKIPKKNRPEIYEAVFTYVFEAREIPIKGVADALWTLIKPQLDANNVRYENGKLGGEYGKRGGRPKKTEDAENPNGVISKTPKGLQSKTPNVNVNDNENVNVNVNANANGSGSDQEGQSGTHTPSFKEVADEVAEQGYRISAVKFFDYYEKQGWKTNEGEPIRNWKTMLKVWDMKEKNESPAAAVKKKSGNRWNNFDQRDYSKEDLEMQLLELGDYANENKSNHQATG